MEEVGKGQFAGDVALVTGGASGIGAATARLFLAEGAAVAVADLDAAAAGRLVAEMPASHALALETDVADETSVERAVERVVERFGRIDVLVNCAGVSIRHPALEMPVDIWDKTFAVNVRGTFLPSRAVARRMKDTGGGTIVNIASIMSYSGGGLYPNPAYMASKGAVLNLTRALAVEWAPLGIRVNAVAPTWVRTPMIEALTSNPELMRRVEQVTPMRRIAEPEEVARAILFLAGPASSMTTGHTLAVDGGFLAV